jgi:23S rRNA (uracil1939-C5)-methyltransferase
MKQQIVMQALQRIGRLPGDAVQQTLGMSDPWRYRNKVELHVQVETVTRRILLGYYQPGTHQVKDIEDCLLIPAGLKEILADIRQGLQEFLDRMEPKTEFPLKHILFRQSFLTGEVALIWVVNTVSDLEWRKWIGEYGLGLINRRPVISSIAENFNPRPYSTLLGKTTRVIFGRPRVQEGIGDFKFLLSPISFYQVNPIQTEVLYQKVLEFAQLTGNETVLDIYCGVGTISLFLARVAERVIGIESVPEAVEDARRNAKLNKVANVHYYKTTAEEWMSRLDKGPKMSRGRGKRQDNENENSSGNRKGNRNLVEVDEDVDVIESKIEHESNDRPDVVVLNPPRGGCGRSVLDGVDWLSPKRIIYVSCNPATLARDLRILVDKGYEIGEVQPVDMFPQTHHVECVVSLNKKHTVE